MRPFCVLGEWPLRERLFNLLNLRLQIIFQLGCQQLSLNRTFAQAVTLSSLAAGQVAGSAAVIGDTAYFPVNTVTSSTIISFTVPPGTTGTPTTGSIPVVGAILGNNLAPDPVNNAWLASNVVGTDTLTAVSLVTGEAVNGPYSTSRSARGWVFAANGKWWVPSGEAR